MNCITCTETLTPGAQLATATPTRNDVSYISGSEYVQTSRSGASHFQLSLMALLASLVMSIVSPSFRNAFTTWTDAGPCAQWLCQQIGESTVDGHLHRHQQGLQGERERASIQVASTCLSFSERVRRSSERIREYKHTLLGQLEAGAKKRKKIEGSSACVVRPRRVSCTSH